MSKVSIITPSRSLKRKKNMKRFFRPVTSVGDLVASVRENVTVDHEVIVVANSLEDQGLLDFLKNEKIDKYCMNNLNAGVSRAWNMGRQLAEGEYLLFINDDVTLGKGSVEKMLEAFQDEKVGIVGPKGENWEGSGKVYETYNGEDVDVISGYCFMVRADVFDQVGGVDVNYTPAGFEEIDLNFAIREEGYIRRVIPDIEVVTQPCHGISAQSTDIVYFRNTIHTEALHLKNKEYFEKKWKIKS